MYLGTTRITTRKSFHGYFVNEQILISIIEVDTLIYR